MFTGIIQDVGVVRTLEQRGNDVRLTVGITALPLDRARTGDSIAVSGVCLTALDLRRDGFSADESDDAGCAASR